MFSHLILLNLIMYAFQITIQNLSNHVSAQGNAILPPEYFPLALNGVLLFFIVAIISLIIIYGNYYHIRKQAAKLGRKITFTDAGIPFIPDAQGCASCLLFFILIIIVAVASFFAISLQLPMEEVIVIVTLIFVIVFFYVALPGLFILTTYFQVRKQRRLLYENNDLPPTKKDA